MREFELVDAPQGVPWGCTICQSAKGPLVDTYVENPMGRLYVCKLCGKRICRRLGFTPGKRLDELNDALTNLEAREAETAAAQKAAEETAAELRQERIRTQELAEQLEAALERERTRAHIDAQLADLTAGRAHVGDAA